MFAVQEVPSDDVYRNVQCTGTNVCAFWSKVFMDLYTVWFVHLIYLLQNMKTAQVLLQPGKVLFLCNLCSCSKTVIMSCNYGNCQAWFGFFFLAWECLHAFYIITKSQSVCVLNGLKKKLFKDACSWFCWQMNLLYMYIPFAIICCWLCTMYLYIY